MEPAANINLYNGVEAPPPPANIVQANSANLILRDLPNELIGPPRYDEIPLVAVRDIPGFYFVSENTLGISVWESLIYVPNQTEFPGRREPPRNVREEILETMAQIAVRFDPEQREAALAPLRERLHEIDMNPALAIVERPAPLNVITLAWRSIQRMEPPQTAEARLEEFLSRAPQARGTPMEAHMLEQFRQREAHERQIYERERNWNISRGPRTAAGLANLRNLQTSRFYRVPWVVRRHAVNAWARSRGNLPARNAPRNARRLTRRKMSRRKRTTH
jgi:hypothetical protein